MEPIYISPSYKRAGSVKVRSLLPSVVLCVHEFEADEYRDKEGGEIAIIPNALRGNMARVRNWMLDHFDTEWLVMVDDDVDTFGYFEGGPEGRKSPTGRRVNPMSEREIREFVINGFVMAEDVEAYLWGVNVQYDPRFYREFSPVTFLSPVLGPFSCIRRNPIRYDERLSLNEDYDYALQHLRKYHRILRFSKYFYMAGHLKDAGGCGAYRLLDEEKKQAETMIRKWGRKVVRYDFRRSTNPIIKVPYKGM